MPCQQQHFSDLCLIVSLLPDSSVISSIVAVTRGGGIQLKSTAVTPFEYGVSNPTQYGVSSSLSNTAYSSQLINMAYQLPLDMVKNLFYPESYDEADEMLDEGENCGIDPLEFLSNVNTVFKNHKKFDGRTQKVIFHSWMNENWNKRYVDNNTSRNNEWKESKNENPSNTAIDSFFKAYDVRTIEKENEQGQTKRKDNNNDDKQPNKRMCKAEKFEAIQYSIGPTKNILLLEFCEYAVFIYLIRRPREGNIDEYWWRIYKSGNLEVLES
ncbi:hypothetical protein Tco_0656152 [Tanacetum coccineum]|uniref:Uncharacterized protein n=1 Tax=Tanacetum coccineum TaxID=301880 RepID=A0ABQ4X8H1_9ASTR